MSEDAKRKMKRDAHNASKIIASIPDRVADLNKSQSHSASYEDKECIGYEINHGYDRVVKLQQQKANGTWNAEITYDKASGAVEDITISQTDKAGRKISYSVTEGESVELGLSDKSLQTQMDNMAAGLLKGDDIQATYNNNKNVLKAPHGTYILANANGGRGGY
jgi:hypothetical protein